MACNVIVRSVMIVNVKRLIGELLLSFLRLDVASASYACRVLFRKRAVSGAA